MALKNRIERLERGGDADYRKTWTDETPEQTWQWVLAFLGLDEDDETEQDLA